MSTNKNSLSLHRSALMCGAAIAIFVIPNVAAAQTQPAAPAQPAAAAQPATTDSTDAVNNSDIVVTARYRKEKLIDIPLAVTALKGEDLSNQGVTNLREISYLTPGVTINSAGGEAYTSPIIRGLVNLNGGASDPNVAVFLDGVYLVNNSAISIGLIDLDRVEVVKGPVSSLYGHNGFAGAINYITKTPGDKFTGYGNATVGNDGQILVTGNLSGPVIPGVLSLGLAGGYEKYDGGYRDAVNGREAGGYKKRDFHGTFSLTPTNNIKLTGGLYYGKDHFDTVALVYAVNNCGPLNPGSAALGESTFTQYCGKLNFQPLEVSAVKPAAGAAGNDREVWNANLRFEADLGFATFSLLGGYNNVKQQRFEDFIGRRNNLVFNSTAGPVRAAELFGGDSNNKDYSIEARLASDQAKPFRWALGSYYYRNDFTTSTLIGIDSSPLPAGASFTGTAALFATPAGQFSTSNLTLVNGVDKQTSVFGSIDWDIVPNLTLNGEIRYTHQWKSQDILRNAFVANVVRPLGAPRSADDNFVNYRVSAKYKITPGVNAYASVATGTKAFGFNSRATLATLASEIAFKPEYITAYEAGLKTDLIDHTLVLNTAVYLNDTRNLQVSGPSSDPTNPGLVTKNIGKTRTKGFEIEAIATPASWFRFNVGVAYVDARFRGDARDYGSAAACAVIASCASRVRTTTNAAGATISYMSLDGLQVLRVSPWTVSAGLDLSAPLGDKLKWFGHADFRLEDKQYMAANNFAFWGDRTLLNVRTGVTYDAIRFTVFVDNVTKNMTVESAAANTRLNDFVANPVGFLPTPRRYGASIGYSF